MIAADHWLDILQRTLVAEVPRRGALGATIALVAARVGGVPLGSAAKGRKRKKKPRRVRRKPRPAPPISSPSLRSCSGGACASVPQWAGNQAEIDYCDFICRQCDGDDPREFCVVAVDPRDPETDVVAVCCDAGKQCCGQTCCGADPAAPGRQCCGDRCVDTQTTHDHCGFCGNDCGAMTCVRGSCCATGLEPFHLCNPLNVPSLSCCSGVCLPNGQCQVWEG
jgi:hypothetical protein